MYLSRIALNDRQRETMRLMASPYLMHGAIERSFSGEKKRNLWRVDWLQDKCYLLLLSQERPHLLNLVQKYGFPDLDRAYETKEYASFLNRLSAGQIWMFRLCANPVRSSFADRNGNSNRGKVYAHVTPEQQRAWLLSRMDKCGFNISQDSFDVVQSEWKNFAKVARQKGGFLAHSHF